MTNLLKTAALALMAIAAAVPSFAEDQKPPEQAAPQGKDAPGSDNGTSIPTPGEHQGVIPPPPTGDTGIETQVPNPNAGTPEEVIPPPGTPGGNPNVEPR